MRQRGLPRLVTPCHLLPGFWVWVGPRSSSLSLALRCYCGPPSSVVCPPTLPVSFLVIFGEKSSFSAACSRSFLAFFPLSPEDSGASPGVLLQRSGYVGGFVSFAPCGAGEQPIKGFSDTQEAPRVTEQSAHIFTVGIC